MKITITQKPQLDAKTLLLEIGGQDADDLVREKGRYVFSVGKKSLQDITPKKLAVLIRKTVRNAKKKHLSKVCIDFDEISTQTTQIDKKICAELVAVNSMLANYEHITYRSKPREGWPEVHEIIIKTADLELKKQFDRGLIIGREINAAREISNTPGGEMTPALLANHAKDAAKGTPIRVSVLSYTQIKKLKMGGIAGVGKGSLSEPKFIIMEYLNGGADKPVVLVGKGITFDSGGLNIKSGPGMNDMHLDMSGGASVIHTVVAAAKLKLKKNIVVLVPAAENMLSGESYRPGDVLKTMSGITIEVMNTDAEGRIVLSDALHYAKKYKPGLVIDVATLTGSAMAAFGHRISALFSTNDDLAKKFTDLGTRTADYVWPMPLSDEYEEDIKGTFGDFLNTPKARADVICAAVFLHQFIKPYEWVHIDIAPRMTTIASDHLAKGSSGAAVYLLIAYLSS